MLYLSLPVCFLIVGAVVCAPERLQSDRDPEDLHMEKRSPYNFGLGKRAYSYVSEYKRLPVYNFGLGKRSRPYSFGLGKRSVMDEAPEESEIDADTLADMMEMDDDDSRVYVKRARPYSFGLGKRFDDSSPNDFNDEKRAKAYDFGLGKRLPLYNFGLGKRAKNYNFGLGKRLSSKFNFGLGKRERDMHRFNFGLGKRSEDSTDDVNYTED